MSPANDDTLKQIWSSLRGLRALPVFAHQPHLLYQLLFEVTRLVSAWPAGSLQLRGPDGELRIAASLGVDPDDLRLVFREGEGLAGRAIKERSVVYSEDVTLDPGFTKKGKTEIRSLIACPVLLNGKAVGVINIHAPDVRERPSPTAFEALALMSAISAPAIQLSRHGSGDE